MKIIFKNLFNFFFIFFILIFLSKNIYGNQAYFDLSDESIKINTNFNGREVIIFGISDPSYDTVLVLKGPNKNARLTIKERLFGIWIETKKFKYKNIPSIFFIASSSPIKTCFDSEDLGGEISSK